jgi:hypothetical protein
VHGGVCALASVYTISKDTQEEGVSVAAVLCRLSLFPLFFVAPFFFFSLVLLCFCSHVVLLTRPPDTRGWGEVMCGASLPRWPFSAPAIPSLSLLRVVCIYTFLLCFSNAERGAGKVREKKREQRRADGLGGDQEREKRRARNTRPRCDVCVL